MRIFKSFRYCQRTQKRRPDNWIYC